MKEKSLRYYWWLTQEYIKKHSKMMLMSSLISFFIIFFLVSFSSYLDAFFFPKKSVVGLVGRYSSRKLPVEVAQKISSGFVYIDENGRTKPAAAESWEIKESGKRFRIHLKKNIFWDDGEPFTASTIELPFKDVSTKVIDPYTIDITLTKPLPIFLTYLSRPLFHQLHGVLGRYKVAKLKSDQGRMTTIVLVPIEEGDATYVYKFYPTESDLITAYKKGEIREMHIVDADAARSFKHWKNTTVEKTTDYSLVMTLFFNTKQPALAEKEVRQAIAQSINREHILMYGEPANSPISPTSWAYNTSLKKIQYDPDTSKKILQKSPLASESASLRLLTYYDLDAVASVVKKDISDVGAKNDVSFNSATSLPEYDMLLAYLKLPADPDQYAFWHSSQVAQNNISNFKSVKIDKVLEDGRNTADRDERQKIYYQFQRIMVDEVPAVFLYYPYSYTIKRKSLL